MSNRKIKVFYPLEIEVDENNKIQSSILPSHQDIQKFCEKQIHSADEETSNIFMFIPFDASAINAASYLKDNLLDWGADGVADLFEGEETWYVNGQEVPIDDEE